jgi:hypothetical protein
MTVSTRLVGTNDVDNELIVEKLLDWMAERKENFEKCLQLKHLEALGSRTKIICLLERPHYYDQQGNRFVLHFKIIKCNMLTYN